VIVSADVPRRDDELCGSELLPLCAPMPTTEAAASANVAVHA